MRIFARITTRLRRAIRVRREAAIQERIRRDEISYRLRKEEAARRKKAMRDDYRRYRY